MHITRGCLQQHVENKKLKRQSQMLLDKLNGVSKQQQQPLQELLPELTEPQTADANSATGTDDQMSLLTNKINSRCPYNSSR